MINSKTQRFSWRLGDVQIGEDVQKSPPWHVERRGDKYHVILDETGKSVGEHDTKEDAEAQLRALYANAT